MSTTFEEETKKIESTAKEVIKLLSDKELSFSDIEAVLFLAKRTIHEKAPVNIQETLCK